MSQVIADGRFIREFQGFARQAYRRLEISKPQVGWMISADAEQPSRSLEG